MVLLGRVLFTLALLALHVFFGWLLTMEAEFAASGAAEGASAAVTDVFRIGDPHLHDGPSRFFPTDHPIALDTTTAHVPLLDQPIMGVRLLDPTFFLRSVRVGFDLRTATAQANTGGGGGDDDGGQVALWPNGGNDAECIPEADQEPVCAPHDIFVAVDYSSTVSNFGNLFPGVGAEKMLSNASAVLPSLRACKRVAVPQAAASQLIAAAHYDDCYLAPLGPDDDVAWHNNVWATCDKLCHCELSLPALPGLRFKVVQALKFNVSDSEFAVTSVELSSFPPPRLGVFIAALIVWALHARICENAFFQVAVAFVVGGCVFLGLFLIFLYNALQKGIDQIPGFGFLRNINRTGAAAGAAGGIGLTAMWALAKVLDRKVKYPTLTGWEDSPLSALHAFLILLGLLGVWFRWKYEIFGKVQVDEPVNEDEEEDFREDEIVMVRRRFKDSNSLIALKTALWALSGYLMLLCWTDLLALVCLWAAVQTAQWLHVRAEHASHIPSDKKRAAMHGGFEDSSTMQIHGRGAFRGDSTPADKLVQTPLNGEPRWALAPEKEQFQQEQLEELRQLYLARPELITRCKIKDQEAIRYMLDGGSHLGPPKPEPRKQGCCKECCVSCKRAALTGLVWLVVITAVVFVAGLVL